MLVGDGVGEAVAAVEVWCGCVADLGADVGDAGASASGLSDCGEGEGLERIGIAAVVGEGIESG